MTWRRCHKEVWRNLLVNKPISHCEVNDITLQSRSNHAQITLQLRRQESVENYAPEMLNEVQRYCPRNKNVVPLHRGHDTKNFV